LRLRVLRLLVGLQISRRTPFPKRDGDVLCHGVRAVLGQPEGPRDAGDLRLNARHPRAVKAVVSGGRL
jgi:hypothetical protein